jgi:ubiquitin carboxyl-terminal hydrolase 9/24
LQLLTSSAVHKWGTEIHEGIYNMLMLLIELVAERMKQDPIPIGLLGVLTMVWYLEIEALLSWFQFN